MKTTIKYGLVAGAMLVACHSQAQDAEAAKSGGMDKTIALGATLTDGNSETMLANGSLLIAGEQEKLGSFKTGLEGNYGENTIRETIVAPDGTVTETERDDKTVANAKAYANVKKTLSAMTFAYLDGSVIHDGMSEIDYRAIVGPGLGMYLIKTDQRKLSVEAGVAQVWEEVADIEDDYLALRLAEVGEGKFENGARVWQSIEFMPEISDFDNHLINAELGVEAPLQGAMNLRVVLQDKYDSEPGAGLERNDLALIAGVSIKL